MFSFWLKTFMCLFNTSALRSQTFNMNFHYVKNLKSKSISRVSSHTTHNSGDVLSYRAWNGIWDKAHAHHLGEIRVSHIYWKLTIRNDKLRLQEENRSVVQFSHIFKTYSKRGEVTTFCEISILTMLSESVLSSSESSSNGVQSPTNLGGFKNPAPGYGSGVHRRNFAFQFSRPLTISTVFPAVAIVSPSLISEPA